MFAIFSIVLCSVGVGALSSREAEGRANMSANEKVNGLCFRGCCISLQNLKAFCNFDFRRPISYYSQQTKLWRPWLSNLLNTRYPIPSRCLTGHVSICLSILYDVSFSLNCNILFLSKPSRNASGLCRFIYHKSGLRWHGFNIRHSKNYRRTGIFRYFLVLSDFVTSSDSFLHDLHLFPNVSCSIHSSIAIRLHFSFESCPMYYRGNFVILTELVCESLA